MEWKRLKDSKALWFGFSTAIILLMAYFADFSEVVESFYQADLLVLIPAFVAGLSVFFVWAYVWFHFLNQMEVHVTFLDSLKFFMAGHFLNSIFPMGQFGGEPFMAYVISDNTEASYGKSFSAVFSSDLVNTVPGMVFMAVGAILMFQTGGVTDNLVGVVTKLIIVMFLGAIIGYYIWFKPSKVRKVTLYLIRTITGFLGRGKVIEEKIGEGMRNAEESLSRVGKDPHALFKILAIAHLGFILQLFCLAFILSSLGVEYTLIPLFFVINLAAFSNFSPTPGGAGTYEAALAGLLTAFLGADLASSTAAGVLFRATTYWPGLLIGYVSLNSLEGELDFGD